MEPLSLQEYICSLDPALLPRVLRVCSGVYFQGSVYEVSGSECCLSTGDFLKVIAVRLQKVICEDVETGHTRELPPTFAGERGCGAPMGAGRGHPPARALRSTRLCLPQAPSSRARTRSPTAACGSCSAARGAARPPGPCASSRPRSCARGEPGAALSAALLPAVRKEVVKIPSTLEVDVEDVTEQAPHVHFIQPLLLSEVLHMEGALPAQAELLEGPGPPGVFKSAWVARLRKGQRIHLHGRGCAWRVLASAPAGGRRFLLSSAYAGRFRQRPRQFGSVHELASGLRAGQRLRVVVTRDCEGAAEEAPPLGAGERLEARELLGATLLCARADDGEELRLPLGLAAAFVEELCDSHTYSLAEALERLPLPADVRVVAKDPSLARDVLASFSALRLEARVTEPFLVGSFCEEPHERFEVPPRWLDVSLFLTGEPVAPPGSADLSRVEELHEHFYYRLLGQLPGGAAPPPPRPPKAKAAAG
ncbi:THMS2 protein, partial [Nothoprocta ornata]|nr:THMS2 protein [Nothoprocta ornata]